MSPNRRILLNIVATYGCRVYALVASVVILMISGCMTAKLSGLERASDPIREEIYHGNGWCRGRSWCGAWDDEKSCDRTLGSVQVKYTYLHALVAVLSFGIYMPVEVDHRLNPKGVEGAVKK